MPALAGVATAPASFATTPDVSLQFEPNTWVLKCTAGTVDISFDGKEVHLTLSSTDAILPINTLRKKLWTKQNGGAATLRWSALSQA